MHLFVEADGERGVKWKKKVHPMQVFVTKGLITCMK